MAYILKVRDNEGKFVNIPAIVGPRGEKGDDGEDMAVKPFFNKIFELLVKLAQFIIDFIKN